MDLLDYVAHAADKLHRTKTPYPLLDLGTRALTAVLDNKLTASEKRIAALEERISRLENRLEVGRAE